MHKRALCIIVATFMVASSFALVGTNAEDTGSGETSFFPGPASYWSYDLAWNYNKTIAVSVGENSSSGNNAWWYSTLTNVWMPIGTGVAGEIFYGVSYDDANDYFYMVGDCVPAAWYWSVGSPSPNGIVGCPASNMKDVVCCGDSIFVAITATRAWNYDMGVWTEIKGALPGFNIALNGVFYDSSNYSIYMSGQGASGSALYYASRQDFSSGKYVAYDISPVGGTDYFLGGSWSSAASMGLLVGTKNITKMTSAVVDSEWREIDTKNTAPMARKYSAWVWCPPTNTFIMYGGQLQVGTGLNDTWEYNPFNRTWKQLFPSTSPGLRCMHQMVFDSISQNVIMYGGYNMSAHQQDTWSFNLTTKEWTLRLATSPFGIRSYYGMVYGFVGGGVGMRPIIHGGYNGASSTNLTYYYSYANNTWTNMSPAGNPPACYYNGMAYDPITQNTLIFGGSGTPLYNKTYMYFPSNNSWWQLYPATVPASRGQMGCAYSSQYNGVVIYGGYYSSTIQNTSYKWNRTSMNWELINTITPTERLYFVCMDADLNGRLHIFSGNASVNYTNKTYTLGRTMYVNRIVLYSNASRTWYAVDWFPDGSQAIVGGDGGNIMEVRPPGIVRAVYNSAFLSNIYSVACKPATSPGYALAMGSAGGVKVNQAFTTGDVTVNSDVPHIAYMDIYDNIGNPVTNSKINVDSGTGANYYDIMAGLYFRGGIANLTRIDIWGWRDNGTGWDMPAALGGAFDAAENGNIRFHYRYNITANQWFQDAPWHGAELESQVWGNPQSYYSVINASYSLVNIHWMPRKQFRSAPGPTVWNETAGNRYNSAVLNGQETVNALNDPFTWDFKVTVTTNDGLNASAYDEFGIFKYNYIGAGDVPATISGSGPPGGTVSLTPEQNVSFISNCNYTLKVYMDDLLRGQANTSRTMPAYALGVMGGDLQNWSFPGTQAHFNGTLSANALYLFGANGSYVNPRDNYTTAHTGYGSIGTVRWRCMIPLGTPEDMYVATVTFMVEHD